jgi:hypothetical protein
MEGLGIGGREAATSWSYDAPRQSQICGLVTTKDSGERTPLSDAIDTEQTLYA